MTYPFKKIEAKWQKRWEKEGVYQAQKSKVKSQKLKVKKFYGLIEFPYPSGEGLHVGHPRSYTAIDIVTRKKRMEGKNVLYPIGWDAFGLPTENFAIKHKVKPQVATKKNVANFTRQLKSLGFGFDWSREINTTDPAYYKWTQWMFLQFFNSYYDEKTKRARPLSELPIPPKVRLGGAKAISAYLDEKRMAYKASTTINWCPSCRIGLANEEAQGGVCERCGGKVEKREKAQWMIRITAYADRLIHDLDTVDYLDRIRTQQINWIGRSEGASVDFVIESAPVKSLRAERGDLSKKIAEPVPSEVEGSFTAPRNDMEGVVTVFTTRPDTLFGATYLVLSSEHPLLDEWLKDGAIENARNVQEYREGSRHKSDIERQESKDKTGVELKGILALNPATGKHIPVWVADYVLAGFGTGAIMAVPAHDERDFEFAMKHGLEIVTVVQQSSRAKRGDLSKKISASSASRRTPRNDELGCFSGAGVAVNSDFLNDLPTAEAKERMIAWLEQEKKGARTVNFKLRDWVFSRQRYWGEPIPIVICDECGYVPVPEKQLPVELPDVRYYQPTVTGESPLAKISSWTKVKCPSCKRPAKRETDTMPNWAGSSWYFLRYCDPHNRKAFADPKKLKYWMPVDLYNGGMEHTTLHLLYSRFWYKFLWDIGAVPEECGSEPYAKRRSHALILGEGGVKMSKSKGNVVNPDDVVEKYGADVFRLYEMFIGPFDADAPWDTRGIEGVKRFLEKVWRVFERPTSYVLGPKSGPKTQDPGPRTKDLELLLHQTIKKVGEDIETLNFNTAVSAMMIFANALSDAGGVSKSTLETFLKLLAPFAPHMSEELWEKLGHKKSIHLEKWPTYDPAKLKTETFELVIQVNGKVRDRLEAAADISDEQAKKLALDSEKIKTYLVGQAPKKIIYVTGRLVSISI